MCQRYDMFFPGKAYVPPLALEYHLTLIGESCPSEKHLVTMTLLYLFKARCCPKNNSLVIK